MASESAAASVLAVSRDDGHRFTKPVVSAVVLLEGLGVEGDAHSGVTVQHRSRVARDPTEPNLRQVHLIHSELFGELAVAGYPVAAGELGENITTEGIDLLGLSRGTVLHIGADAVVEITGLRNPCTQINGLAHGLMKQVLAHDAVGNVVRKTGVMGIVLRGGVVKPGDGIRIETPADHLVLEPV